MNIKDAFGAMGQKLSSVGSEIVNGVAAGAGKVDNLGVATTNAAINLAGDRMLVHGTRASAKAGTGFVTDMTSNTARRVVSGIGGGAEGLVLGATSGAVVGGVAGGIDDDESFLGGAAKGALIGGGIAGIGGAASGAIHIDPRILNNTATDLANAKNSLVGMGRDGVNLVKSKFGKQG